MIYVFSWLSRKHPNVMRFLLAARTLLYVLFGNLATVAISVLLFLFVNMFAGLVAAFWTAVIVAVLCSAAIATVPHLKHLRLLQTYCAFRRRWPTVYSQSGIRRLVDDGELIRSVMSAPKLGEFPQLKDGNIVLTIRPSVGSTLKDLEENSDVLAAAYPRIRSISVLAPFAQASKGLISITPMEGI